MSRVQSKAAYDARKTERIIVKCKAKAEREVYAEMVRDERAAYKSARKVEKESRRSVLPKKTTKVVVGNTLYKKSDDLIHIKEVEVEDLVEDIIIKPKFIFDDFECI